MVSDTMFTSRNTMPPPPPRAPRERPLIRPQLFLQEPPYDPCDSSTKLTTGLFSNSCMKIQTSLQPLKPKCELPATVTPTAPTSTPGNSITPGLKRKDSNGSISSDDCSMTMNPRPPKVTKSAENLVLETPLKPEKDDVNALCNAVGEWKPFVSKVARFIEVKKLPFEYFDIWAPDPDSEQAKESSSSTELVLRHVGHATNRNTEMSSIFTMYHMNQFGTCSESYAFPPGVGLPGRVLAKGKPMWDDSLQRARYVDFPRGELAKKHGVKKGLGIPLSGQAIMVMYTTQDIREDTGFVQTTYQEFSKIPQLPMMAGSSSCVTTTKPGPAKQEKQLTNSPTTKVKAEDDDDIEIDYKAILPDDTEVEMARLLTQHLPQRSKALQRLLWRPPYRRTYADNVSLAKLKKRYKAFLLQQSPKKMKDVALLVVKEWESLRPSNKIFKW